MGTLLNEIPEYEIDVKTENGGAGELCKFYLNQLPAALLACSINGGSACNTYFDCINYLNKYC